MANFISLFTAAISMQKKTNPLHYFGKIKIDQIIFFAHFPLTTAASLLIDIFFFAIRNVHSYTISIYGIINIALKYIFSLSRFLFHLLNQQNKPTISIFHSKWKFHIIVKKAKACQRLVVQQTNTISTLIMNEHAMVHMKQFIHKIMSKERKKINEEERERYKLVFVCIANND